MNRKNPFKDLKLDAEEREIERAINAGEWKPIPNLKKEIERYRSYAKFTLEKTRNINIRLSQQTVHALKIKAMSEGMPYQTLAASVLHKYAMGA
ncbi:MAG: antitoxin [Patescibacteria group bacterium]